MLQAPLKPLEELFHAKAIDLLLQHKLLPPERVQILDSWKHSGSKENGQNLPLEPGAPLCHHSAMFGESGSQFSFTRAALSTWVGQKSKFLSVSV